MRTGGGTPGAFASRRRRLQLSAPRLRVQASVSLRPMGSGGSAPYVIASSQEMACGWVGPVHGEAIPTLRAIEPHMNLMKMSQIAGNIYLPSEKWRQSCVRLE